MAVDRCVCHNLRFEHLLGVARDRGMGLRALVRETRCGTGCGMCVPYIQVMLNTGKTELPVLRPAEIKQVLASISVDGRRSRPIQTA